MSCFALPCSALDIFEELHKECSASAPPQALEFKLTESSPGLSLYLYPETAYKGTPSGFPDSSSSHHCILHRSAGGCTELRQCLRTFCVHLTAVSTQPPAATGSGISYPVFLGFVVADGALEMGYECILSMRLPLVLDLDETVVKAYTVTKLTKEIDELTEQMARRDAGCGM